MKNYTWVLFEQGFVHTMDLSKDQAEEMLERHKRCFPDLDWYIEHLEYSYANQLPRA